MISVIIPTYNAAHYLPTAIDSVLSQAIKDIEIIVVDDGSTDNTKEVIKSYLDRIHYIYQENKGPSCARNRGIACAKGEYIAFLDADETWVPQKLEIQINFLKEHPEYVMVYTDFLKFNKKKNLTFPFLKGRIAAKSGFIFKELITNNFIPTATVVVKKECFKRVGLFDESLRSVEDRDMWLRIAKEYKIGFIDTPTLISEIHDTGLSDNRENALKGLINVLRKHEKIEDRKIRNHIIDRLSLAYFQLGYFYFDRGAYINARNIFLKSLSYKMRSRSAALLLLTFIRPKYVEFIRRIKRQILMHKIR